MKTSKQKALETAIPADDMKRLKAEHGDVYVILVPNPPAASGEEQPPDAIAVRAPKPIEIEELIDNALDDRRKRKAAQDLGTTCVVWPDDKTFEALVARRPGLPLTIAGLVQKIAGIVDTAEMGKA